MKTFVTTVALVAATATITDVHAHTYLTQPLAEFKAGASKSSWVAEFQPPWTGTFKTGADYAAVAPGKGFKDLKSFLDSKGPTCGNSLANAKAKPIPSDGMIKLASTIEHAGPCEVWLGNTMAYHNDDCEKTFGSATSFKVDFSSCKGSCLLSFYWLGLQDGGKRWQSYKNCVPLGGGGSSSGGTSSNESNTDSKTDAKTDAKTDSKTDSKSDSKSDSSSSTTKKPKSTTTPKPKKESSSTPKPKKESRSIDDEEYSFSDLDAWKTGNNTTGTD